MESIAAKTRPVVAVNLADYRNIHQKRMAASQLRSAPVKKREGAIAGIFDA
jgi:hypothetical protein